jgi:hypothetical protein
MNAKTLRSFASTFFIKHMMKLKIVLVHEKNQSLKDSIFPLVCAFCKI